MYEVFLIIFQTPEKVNAPRYNKWIPLKQLHKWTPLKNNQCTMMHGSSKFSPLTVILVLQAGYWRCWTLGCWILGVLSEQNNLGGYHRPAILWLNPWLTLKLTNRMTACTRWTFLWTGVKKWMYLSKLRLHILVPLWAYGIVWSATLTGQFTVKKAFYWTMVTRFLLWSTSDVGKFVRYVVRAHDSPQAILFIHQWKWRLVA